MPVSAVKTRLGNDVSLWCQMLSEAKAARAVVENSNREKSFGPVIVDYSSVQAKVIYFVLLSDCFPPCVRPLSVSILTQRMHVCSCTCHAKRTRFENQDNAQSIRILRNKRIKEIFFCRGPFVVLFLDSLNGSSDYVALDTWYKMYRVSDTVFTYFHVECNSRYHHRN